MPCVPRSYSRFSPDRTGKPPTGPGRISRVIHRPRLLLLCCAMASSSTWCSAAILNIARLRTLLLNSRAPSKNTARNRLLPSCQFLFLHANEYAGGGVHVYREFGLIAAGAVDYVPHQVTVSAAPVEQVEHRSVWTFLQQFVAAMFLGDIEGLVGIRFEKLNIEDRGRGVAGTIAVLDTGVHTARAIRRINAIPSERFQAMLQSRCETTLPHGRFSVVSVGLWRRLRFEAKRLCIAGPAMGGDE